MSNQIDYIEVLEKAKICVERMGVSGREIWITPLRSGYRIEFVPNLSMDTLEYISKCIEKELNTRVVIRESSRGMPAIILETTK